MDKFKFEKLIVWQKAIDLEEDINLLIDNFPKKEIYNLSSQLLRAGDSVAHKYYDESFHLMNMLVAFKRKLN